MAKTKDLKIALVHDYIKDIGGAELVLETLSEIFPDAPIYTSLYRPSYFGPHRFRLETKWSGRIHQSLIGYLPFAEKLISPIRFLSPLLFRSFDFSSYDLIISSATGAYFPNALNKKQAKLISYCHTPPRYLYGLATARALNTWFYRLINIPLQFILHFYRLFDFKFAQNVDLFIANSSTTAARIKKFYRRDSVIINPPIDVPPILPTVKRQNYFLIGGRLARAKRYDIALAACKKLDLPLKVFGRDFADYENELKQIASSKTEFLGEVDQSTKAKLFSQARAFIFCSDNEDFGMVSLEAQSYGCPVIGFNSGGIAETVIDGKTGYLFDDLTVDSCVSAIRKLIDKPINPSTCFQHAQTYGTASFVSKLTALVRQDTL